MRDSYTTSVNVYLVGDADGYVLTFFRLQD